MFWMPDDATNTFRHNSKQQIGSIFYITLLNTTQDLCKNYYLLLGMGFRFGVYIKSL